LNTTHTWYLFVCFIISKTIKMMFRLALISTLFVSASALSGPTESVEGKKIMSKARKLNGQYEEDLSWMTKFSMKFQSCHSIHSWGGEAGGGGQEDGVAHGSQHLVNFALCPSGQKSCSGGGEYVVELSEFVQAYTEAKKESEEAQCEAVQESCNCNYYDDEDVCFSGCYSKAGLDFCVEDENEFEIEDYLECKEAEFQNNYYQAYYIGPVCSSNGKAIHLELFTDESCSVAAKSGTYEKYNYSASLPYSKQSMVSNDLVSCKQENDDNNNNNGDDANANNNNNGNYYYEEPEVVEMCEQLYEEAAKCEKNLKYKNSAYRDTGSCDYIQKVLPALERVYHKNGGGGAATGFAIFFGLSTVAASAAAYYFFSKVERSTVDLASKEGNSFA